MNETLGVTDIGAESGFSEPSSNNSLVGFIDFHINVLGEGSNPFASSFDLNSTVIWGF